MMLLRDDPRADPRLVAALATVGLDGALQPAPVTFASPLEAKREFCAATEAAFGQLFEVLFADLPPVGGVTSHTETIAGPDGNDLALYIHRAVADPGPRPCVVHLHGGGMTILRASDPPYVRWRDELAAAGVVVVGVEFRNAAGALGSHPFPAGLDDCAAALAWVADHAADLGITQIVVSGESGGANLSLATALRAKRDGTLGRIAGVHALCPYISNAWADPRPDLPSLAENDGYFIDCALLAVLASVYDPDGAHARDPLCWPLGATAADLQGLPPHVISVNELDPLRDEGLAYLRALLAAGVPAVGRTVNGTTHAGDVVLRGAIPDVYAATVRDIAGFARSL